MTLLELIKDFSALGKGENEFWHPQRPYLDEDGRLWIADWNNNRVKGVKPQESQIVVEAKRLPQFVAKEGDRLIIGYYDKGIEVCNLSDGHRQEYEVGRDGDACFHKRIIYVVNGGDSFVYQLPEVRPIASLDDHTRFIASDQNRLFVATYNYKTRKYSFFQLTVNGQGVTERIKVPCDEVGDMVDFDVEGNLFLATRSGNILTVDPKSGEGQSIPIPIALNNYFFTGISVRTVKGEKIVGLTTGSDVVYFMLKGQQTT